MIKRRSTVVSITDDDSDIDKITSYCARCESYGFLSELGPRIYPNNERPIPHDSDIWLQCYRCGIIISKVHAKHENEFGTIIEPTANIHDSQKVIMKPLYERSKSYKMKRKSIQRINSAKVPSETDDKDLQSLLSQGRQLISYNDSTK